MEQKETVRATIMPKSALAMPIRMVSLVELQYKYEKPIACNRKLVFTPVEWCTSTLYSNAGLHVYLIKSHINNTGLQVRNNYEANNKKSKATNVWQRKMQFLYTGGWPCLENKICVLCLKQGMALNGQIRVV